MSSVVRDKNGILWITTVEGLNSFDGYTVKKYYKEDHPELGSNNLAGIICDEKNRLWVRSVGGIVTLLDEKRNMRRVPVWDNGKEVNPGFIRQTKKHGIVLFKGEKLYVLQETDSIYFKKLLWKEDTILRHSYSQIVNDGNDILLMSGSNRLCLFDAANLNVLYNSTVPGIIGVARLNSDELLITTDKNFELLRFSLSQSKVVANYGRMRDQFGENIKGNLRHIRHMIDGRYIISSSNGGVYIFDAVREVLLRYQHDVLDSRSLSANNTVYVHTDSSGYVYITSRTSGLNYFNSNYPLASYRSVFRETTSAEIFEGSVNAITQHPNGNIWIGAQKGLVEWVTSKNIFRFYDYGNENGVAFKGVEEVNRLCFDKDDRLWVGMQRYGIVVLNKDRKVIKYINTNTTIGKLPANQINGITLAPDNKIWAATGTGLCIIDPASFSINNFSSDSLLKILGTTYCYEVWFRNESEVWIATNKGAYRYNKKLKQLNFFDTQHGLPGNTVVCFTDDINGNVYVGTYSGMAVISNDRVVKVFRRNNGLRSDRCQGFIKDAKGKIWIANDRALLCFNPVDNSFKAYDESYGLSPSGFRLHSFYQAQNGEQFWGSDAGISNFFPQQLEKVEPPLQVTINSFSAGGINYGFPINETIDVPYKNNNLQFSFSAVDLFSSKNIIYEYRLLWSDDNWKRANNPQQVSYNSLSPGRHIFNVRASRDGTHWVNSTNAVNVFIRSPWWKSWWFVIAVIVAALSLIGWWLRRRSKLVKLQRVQLETEQAINYFASSIYEQQAVDDILWDVAKNCIGRLHFEDCVIYLKDEETNMLVQKAAWGPKTTLENKIINPIEIPIGKGIVGSVAQTGISEIINDTSNDGRYIVDDVRRLSEITVPIVFNNRVLGVIDSESSQRNFYTSRHLSILTTVASLCANKIIRNRAEAARQKAQMELLEHQRKMAEIQLKSLRLQMNPHFLFNSLNSIQQIILSGNDTAATRYLSKFSRLLRMVLQHSDKEKISLKEEVETLSLYLELESLRFDNSFVYNIDSSDLQEIDEIKIPTLLVQPFVENALWHGLLHKDGERKLFIRFSEDGLDNLICIVEDNGIGRMAAQTRNNRELHAGKGISVAEERIKTFNEQNIQRSSFTIEDLKDDKGLAAGTRITLWLPLIK